MTDTAMIRPVISPLLADGLEVTVVVVLPPITGLIMPAMPPPICPATCWKSIGSEDMQIAASGCDLRLKNQFLVDNRLEEEHQLHALAGTQAQLVLRQEVQHKLCLHSQQAVFILRIPLGTGNLDRNRDI